MKFQGLWAEREGKVSESLDLVTMLAKPDTQDMDPMEYWATQSF